MVIKECTRWGVRTEVRNSKGNLLSRCLWFDTETKRGMIYVTIITRSKDYKTEIRAGVNDGELVTAHVELKDFKAYDKITGSEINDSFFKVREELLQEIQKTVTNEDITEGIKVSQLKYKKVDQRPDLYVPKESMINLDAMKSSEDQKEVLDAVSSVSKMMPSFKVDDTEVTVGELIDHSIIAVNKMAEILPDKYKKK